MLRFVRYWLPGLICLAGLVILAIKRDESGIEAAVGLVAAGSSLLLLNYLWRMGVSGESDRRDEDATRAYFDRHGRWPDEE